MIINTNCCLLAEGVTSAPSPGILTGRLQAAALTSACHICSDCSLLRGSLFPAVSDAQNSTRQVALSCLPPSMGPVLFLLIAHFSVCDIYINSFCFYASVQQSTSEKAETDVDPGAATDQKTPFMLKKNLSCFKRWSKSSYHRHLELVHEPADGLLLPGLDVSLCGWSWAPHCMQEGLDTGAMAGDVGAWGSGLSSRSLAVSGTRYFMEDQKCHLLPCGEGWCGWFSVSLCFILAKVNFLFFRHSAFLSFVSKFFVVVSWQEPAALCCNSCASNRTSLLWSVWYCRSCMNADLLLWWGVPTTKTFLCAVIFNTYS